MAVTILADDGLVVLQDSPEDRFVFQIGEAQLLLRILRSCKSRKLIQGLEAAIEHSKLRGLRRRGIVRGGASGPALR